MFDVTENMYGPCPEFCPMSLYRSLGVLLLISFGIWIGFLASLVYELTTRGPLPPDARVHPPELLIVVSGPMSLLMGGIARAWLMIRRSRFAIDSVPWYTPIACGVPYFPLLLLFVSLILRIPHLPNHVIGTLAARATFGLPIALAEVMARRTLPQVHRAEPNET